MRGLIAIVLGLSLAGVATAVSAAQCGDMMQQDKSQQNSADEAQVRGDLRAGSDCATPEDKAMSEKKNEDAAERAKSKMGEKAGTTGQAAPQQ